MFTTCARTVLVSTPQEVKTNTIPILGLHIWFLISQFYLKLIENSEINCAVFQNI